MTTIEVKLECLRKAIEITPTLANDAMLVGIQAYNSSKNPTIVLEIAEQFYNWVTKER